MEKFFKPKEKPKAYEEAKAARKKIADDTLEALEHESFDLDGVTHDLNARMEKSKRNTKYYAPDSLLSMWARPPIQNSSSSSANCKLIFLDISTLDGARLLASDSASGKIGVLNFASAKKPGGGFLSGMQAQEESIARSSTLYPSLMTENAQKFYMTHAQDSRHGYYSHAIIYSPGIILFRDDAGGWLHPIEVDVLTSPAVNAGEVRSKLLKKMSPEALETKIEQEMKARMGRILYLFEKAGARSLVLGSFGTGVFKNDVAVVSKLWAQLLATRFRHSFFQVVFAIIGNKIGFTEFVDTFKVETDKIKMQKTSS